ncbi:hypothetical protein JZ751_027524 [Albula glossodonta]|uniref:Uncharacterized protein n=1 Tax=Albula glossodonta TaxID=121402 RepID=A0A8T2NJP3_9TELE|nr:hypothetical protein JZ751_027524 [Albula glossodonta]
MEALLKKELGTSMLKATGHSGGGCISEGQSYDIDSGRVFAKVNHKKVCPASVATIPNCTKIRRLNKIVRMGRASPP